METASTKKEGFKPGNLWGVIVFLTRYPGQVALSVAMLLAMIAIELSLPQILGTALDSLRQQGRTGAPFPLRLQVQLFVGLVLVRAGLAYLLGPIRNRLIQQALMDIRVAIYDAIQRLAFQYHDRSHSGELISRSTTDVLRLQDFFFACLFLSLDIVVLLMATMVLIFLASPALGLVALAVLAPTLGLVAYFAGQLRPRWREVHDLHGAMTTVIQENIAGVRVVKAFAREHAEIDKFRQRKSEFLASLLSTVNWWASRIPLAQFVYGLSVPLALWIGGRQVIRGELTMGDLAKVLFYLLAIGHRVGLVGQFTSIIQNASASAERILEIIQEPKTIRSGHRDLPPGPGTVRFEAVGFNYQDGKASINDVSFEAVPGRTIAIVGPTGAGKTTLVNLIPRFYDVSAGRVLVEGIDVRELKLSQLRRSISVIFQETFLFSATVAENIAYGYPQANRAEIERCARAAQAHAFIVELEDGYDSLVGERGITLSGGQKQRLAIARAFLMNPRILILDDATASVDPETEHLIQEAMQSLCRGRTTFVIAHRAATVQHADQILVLQAGRIAEQGTHQELLRRRSFYLEIFQQQISPD